jgi:AAA+ superfamily predicted ATPase
LRMSFVSCPALTTMPYTHSVFRNWAPRSSIWFGPTGTLVGAAPGIADER